MPDEEKTTAAVSEGNPATTGEENTAGATTVAESETTDAGKSEGEETPNLLHKEAKELGFSDDEIAAFEENEGALEKMLTVMGKKMMSLVHLPDEETGKEKEPEKRETVKDQKPTEGELKALDENDFDPQVVQYAKQTNVHSQEIKQLRQEMKELKEFIAPIHQDRAAQMKESVDEFGQFLQNSVKSLGQDWTGIFGSGDPMKLNPQSVEYKNWGRLCKTMNILHLGSLAAGVPALSREVAFQNAMRQEFGDDMSKFKMKKLGESLDKRKSQMTEKPTSRKTVQTGEQEAAQFATEFFRKRGKKK